MALNRYGNKRDANEASIVAIIRGYGMSVYPLDVPADALVGHKGRTYLVEVKDGPKPKLTDPQIKFTDSWLGGYVVLRSDDEAIAWCKKLREVNVPSMGAN